ncbi:MAG: DNA replication/repair protein RecF [Bacilli bacterium]|nr:DNA replication/repair protein RecF [Bacilli bacterium]
MIIKSLTVRNFRNHSLRNIEFGEGINLIVGPNASGKTNIVEAIYYLSLARSFRGVSDEEIINDKSEYSQIDAIVLEGEIRRNIRILITKRGRSVLVNGKKVSKLSDLTKCVNVLLFEPKDVMLFRGSPKERRNFLDINLSKQFPIYLEYISRYEKALKQRNEILKSSKVDEKLLEASTELLVKYAGPIINYRAMFVKDIHDILIKITHALTGVKSKIDITYKPFVNMSSDYQSIALEAFNRSLESDLKHKVTSIGIHREDISVSLNGKDIGTHGSQGENRLIALALKLSPYFMIEDKDKKPVVVLDDVMSELDATHRDRLIKFLRKFEQVFITDTKLEIEGATRIEIRK